jgi:hypothetical protein
MNETHSQVMSAFVDGEAVDPDALAAALDDGEARLLLVDFVRLRGAAGRMDEGLPASLAAFRRKPIWHRTVPMPAVAALVLIALLASWFVPRPPQDAGPPLPPAPSRTLSFEPGLEWQEGQP